MKKPAVVFFLFLSILLFWNISCSQEQEKTTTTVQKVELPQFSVDSGTTFETSLSINFTCLTSGATILYSYDNLYWINGSTIIITETVTIFVKAIKSGMIDSDVVSATYIKGASTSTTTTTVPSFIVSFDSLGGSPISSQTINYGGFVTEPSNPTKVGYTFAGWYKEESYLTPWNFDSDAVKKDTTLYAKFTDALWARSVTTGVGASEFNSITVDTNGNIYAVGYQSGMESYTYGNGVSVAGSYSGKNVILVKYNSFGTALWARSVTSGTGDSIFNSVVVDALGNIYATGYQFGTGNCAYGVGVNVAGTHSCENIVIVKYNSLGNAQWARSISSFGTSYSEFKSVAVDVLGNIYAVGHQNGNGSYNYGSNISVDGSSSYTNAVLVKYNSLGTTLWAKSITTGTGYSRFQSIAVDASGNIYAAGYQAGPGKYTYGTDVSVAGTSSGNVVLVKYNTSGTALWAKSITAGTDSSIYTSVAVDASGNIYAAGCQGGTGSCTYGVGVSVAGSYSDENVVLVKYNSSGNALWARSVTTGNHRSIFYSVDVDASGNIYAAGAQFGTGNYTYGSGVSVAGSYLGYFNAVLVKYNSLGTALWAKTVTTGTSTSEFLSVKIDASGNIYSAGSQSGDGSYPSHTYGVGVSVAGSYLGSNCRG